MGIGYVFGCLFSILLWRLDRQGLFNFINIKLWKKVKNIYVIQFLYLSAVIAIYIGLTFIKSNEVYNALTAFIVIDISNTERKNLNHTERKQFYDTMSTISRSLVCGFIAPLFYITIFGNGAAIVFTLIFNLSLDEDLNIIGTILAIATIIPALIAEAFLYVIYAFKNKNLKIKFKGDFISNLLKKPLLNVDILAAYIESVNFYFHYNGNNMHYLKSYGEYNNKIDDSCIKDYLSISYSICFIIFTAILLLKLV
ncbi:hypothetical protein G9F72_017125 [Clostridium estertheticum]|uniref:hypothetical protein n=1 Tax=Clostridium estertheticum TaxID=238834 RepID=UPI0013E96B4B|nr:hypothetical protein [Clostridium estertheticum]MBZ9688057.1 hypothetical protein [Clostridium estertheticum]